MSCYILVMLFLIYWVFVKKKIAKNWKIYLDEFTPFLTLNKDLDGKRHGGELVAKVLKDHGITHIFTLSGGHISPVLVSSENVGIKVIDTRHEVNAVFAADAFSRLSGKVGVAVVTAGPGVTNTITAMKNAQMAESPLLLLGGAAATFLKGRGSLQDIDQVSLFKSLCKHVVTVSSVRRIIPSIREAMCIAQSDAPGPVFVELPLDVLYPYDVVVKEVMSKKEPKGLFAQLVNKYVHWRLHRVYANAFQECDSTPLQISTPLASDHEIENCKKLIETCEKPVVIVGSQSVLPASSVDNVQNALLQMGIPCFLSGMARGMLGKENPLLMRQKRGEALKEADLVILAGAVCDFRMSYGRVLNRKSKIIAVNLNKKQLYKNSDVFWKPTIAVNASVSDFLVRLSQAVDKRSSNDEWINTLRKRDEEKEKINIEMAKNIPKQHLNPMKVLFDLENSLDTNTILIADGGDFVATASYILRPRGPLKWLDPGPFGTLGVGGGFAIGAKCAQPDSNVVIIYGDGSLGYSLMEFDTFHRHKLPVAAVVGNDACWTQIEREQINMFKSDIACNLQFSDYHIAAKGIGAEGICLKSSDNDRVKEIIASALEIPKNGKSILINVLIGKSDFRSGSISV